MTTTVKAPVPPKVERKGGGMRRWMFMEPYWSEIGGKRFLTRFVFIFCPWFGCHITRIHMADDQREHPHDHSATFCSFRLSGWYEEDVYAGDPRNPVQTHRRHGWLSARRLRYDQAHSITKISRWPLVTILFLGRRRQASNYWTPEGKQSLGMTMDQEWS